MPQKPVKKSKPAAADSPERVKKILAALRRAYPEADCALRHTGAWQLLVATILSAQCTDTRVNQITPGLFKKFPDVRDMARLTPAELEPEIRSSGFFRNKAKSIIGAAQAVEERFHGQVPRAMPELLELPGVARKTANVVLGVAYEQAEGVVVDTHVRRIARRLELTRENSPERIERDLMRILPRGEWIGFSHRLIAHGRKICLARKPRCPQCPLQSLCNSSDKIL